MSTCTSKRSRRIDALKALHEQPVRSDAGGRHQRSKPVPLVPALALRGGSTTQTIDSPAIDAALDRVRHAASDDEYRDGVARLPAGHRSTIRRRSSWPGASARAPSAAGSRCPAGRRARRPGDAPPVETGRGRTHRRAETEAMTTPNPPHRDALRAAAGAGRRRCRCSPTARVSILSLQRGTRESVVSGNQNVATRAAEEIRRYIVTNAELLKALAADLQDTGLDAWQQDRILKNYVLAVPRVPRDHAVRRGRRGDRHEPRRQAARRDPERRAADHRRRVDVADPRRRGSAADHGVRHPPDAARTSRPAGWSASSASKRCGGWSISIRIGEHGFALVVAPDGELIAHGDPDKKALVAQTTQHERPPAGRRARAPTAATDPCRIEYTDDGRPQQLGVAARIAPLGWTVIVEQPTARGLRQRHASCSGSSSSPSRSRCW